MLEWFSHHVVSFTVFFPLIIALAILINPFQTKDKWLALLGSIACFLGSLHIWHYFKPNTANLQFTEEYSWIEEFGVQYFVGIDGLNILLVLLTTFLTPLVILCLWQSQIRNKKAFLSLIMALETGMIGALVSFDLVVFYIFWETILIPMYFIIGVWGGSNRIYATTKFIIYTALGSLIMLLAAITLYILHYQQHGFYSTNLLNLYSVNIFNLNHQMMLFSAFALAFAIKVPIWPFHTWLPHAHTEAPTVGSVILASILLKMGTYGFLRFAIPLFPDAVTIAAPYITLLGIIGIIYGALTAWAQTDAKKMIAYSSVSHLGYVVIGSVAIAHLQLSEEALVGASYQMINHGISTGALFFLIGILYERRHTRLIADYGGIAKKMPWFSVIFIVATLGSVGLPGTGGFIGEFLILLGVFQTNPMVGVLASIGVLLGALYMLALCRRILFGPLDKQENKSLKDLSKIELSYLAPLAVLVVVTGLFPNFFLDKIKPSVSHLAKRYQHYYIAVDKPAAKDNHLAFSDKKGIW